MHPNVKRGLAAAACAIVVYFVLFPLLWPGPTVGAVVPDEVRMNDTLPIRASVSAWHSNVHIHQVRFYVDYTATTATGPKGIFYPELIVQRDAVRYAGSFGRNPITWPFSQYVDAQLDLNKFVEQGLIGPGELIGTIDITFNYHPGRGGKTINRDRTRTATKSVPFSITIRE